MHLQYAIDVFDQEDALAKAETAIEAGVRCVEAGHLLIKAVGLGIVTEMRRRYGHAEIVADMKTMDMGADEVRLAADAGAHTVIVCGAASDGTVVAALEQAKSDGVTLMVSLMGVQQRLPRTRELMKLGVRRVIAHRGVDETYAWHEPRPMNDLQALTELDGLRVALAGGLSTAIAPILFDLAFERLIVVRGVSEAADPGLAIRTLMSEIEFRTRTHASTE